MPLFPVRLSAFSLRLRSVLFFVVVCPLALVSVSLRAQGRAQCGDCSAPQSETSGTFGRDDPAGPRVHPSITVGAPSAFGPRWGQVYAGVAYQNRIRYDDWRDGILTAGAGLGHPERYVGLDLAVHILDTYDQFARDRSLSLKLHRRLPGRAALAVGCENVWHTAGTDGGSSRYAVGSKLIVLRQHAPFLGAAVVSAGVGNDRFLPEARFARGAAGVNGFGSLAVQVARGANAVATWTGQDLNLGLSVAPSWAGPVVVTPVLSDVVGTAGDGARFGVMVGVQYTRTR